MINKESVLCLAARAYPYSIFLPLIYVEVEIDKKEKAFLSDMYLIGRFIHW